MVTVTPDPWSHMTLRIGSRYVNAFLGYGDGAGNTADENSSVFSLIRMR